MVVFGSLDRLIDDDVAYPEEEPPNTNPEAINRSYVVYIGGKEAG